MSFYNALVFLSEKILEGERKLWTTSLSLLKVSKLGILHFVEGFEPCRPGIVLGWDALIPPYFRSSWVRFQGEPDPRALINVFYTKL